MTYISDGFNGILISRDDSDDQSSALVSQLPVDDKEDRIMRLR